MESRNLLPQNTRLMANLLSFSGGALDVFKEWQGDQWGKTMLEQQFTRR